MLSEIDISGVYVAPIAVYGVAATPVALAIRWLLWRSGLLGWFWYPSMVTLSIYVATLALLVLYV